MKFKKFLSVFLTFFLLLSNIGLAFTIHYCDNKISSVSINRASNFSEGEKDCCGKIELQSRCCKNKIIKSVDKSDQVIVKIASINSSYNLVYKQWQPAVFTTKFHFYKRDISTYYCDANAPPLYLLYGQYTFYA